MTIQDGKTIIGMEFRNKFGDDFIKKNLNKLGSVFQNNGDELIVNIGLYKTR